jgi:hypothetical protein
MLYSGASGQSVLVTVGADKGSVGPSLALLRAAKVLIGRA